MTENPQFPLFCTVSTFNWSTFCACGRSKDLWHLSLSIFPVCFFFNPRSSCFDFNAKVPWPSQVHVSPAPLNQSEMNNRNSVHFLCDYILEVFSLSLSPLQNPSLIYHLLSKQEQSLAPYTLQPFATQHPCLQIRHRVRTHVIGSHLSKRQSFKKEMNPNSWHSCPSCSMQMSWQTIMVLPDRCF